jgi:hypothetical protein
LDGVGGFRAEKPKKKHFYFDNLLITVISDIGFKLGEDSNMSG